MLDSIHISVLVDNKPPCHGILSTKIVNLSMSSLFCCPSIVLDVQNDVPEHNFLQLFRQLCYYSCFFRNQKLNFNNFFLCNLDLT